MRIRPTHTLVYVFVAAFAAPLAGCGHSAGGGNGCCPDMATGGGGGGGDMACDGAGCAAGGDDMACSGVACSTGGDDMACSGAGCTTGGGDMAGPVCVNCTPVAQMQTDPFAVAVDGTNVYWTAHSDANTDGVVWTQAKSGGTATMLATMQYGPRDILVSGGNLYWNNYFGGEVWQLAPAPSGTSTNEVSAAGQIVQFAVDDTNHAVYHLEKNATAIFATPLDGSKTNTLVTPVVTGQRPTAFATDDTNLYWINSGDNSIESTPLPSGTATPLQTGLTQPGLIVYFNGELYFTSAVSISKCSTTANSTVTPLATGLAKPVTSLVVDADGIYWTEIADGSVWRRKNSDGQVALVANQQANPRSLAVDATDIYWVNLGTAGANDGVIMKAAK